MIIFNDGLVKPPLWLQHEWVIMFNGVNWMLFAYRYPEPDIGLTNLCQQTN